MEFQRCAASRPLKFELRGVGPTLCGGWSCKGALWISALACLGLDISFSWRFLFWWRKTFNSKRKPFISAIDVWYIGESRSVFFPPDTSPDFCSSSTPSSMSLYIRFHRSCFPKDSLTRPSFLLERQPLGGERQLSRSEGADWPARPAAPFMASGFQNRFRGLDFSRAYSMLEVWGKSLLLGRYPLRPKCVL